LRLEAVTGSTVSLEEQVPPERLSTTEFKKISVGTCGDHGMTPILDETLCAAAARTLKGPDVTVAATVLPNRPEGCYFYKDTGTADFDDTVDGLWLSVSAVNRGRGAEQSDVGAGMIRSPICAPHSNCGMVDVDVEYQGVAYQHMAPIPSAGVCCEKCQVDSRCGSWTWSRREHGDHGETYVCSLLEPQQERAAPARLRREGFVSGLPVRDRRPGSLYCLALTQPHGDELTLLQMQHAERVSLFACEEHAIFSNAEVKVGPGVQTNVIESDLKCEVGGDAGTALNAGIFIALWKKVIDSGRFRFHDWTVKIDADAVFFPDRLRGRLHEVVDGGNGTYVNNCKYGLHGPIEVFSRSAIELYGENYMQCERKFWFAYSHWGEDMYMDQCLEKVLGIERVDDFSLICEDHCDCPEYVDCTSGAVTFHPFKTVAVYRQCMLNAGLMLRT
jgi:hypothetical protein